MDSRRYRGPAGDDLPSRARRPFLPTVVSERNLEKGARRQKKFVRTDPDVGVLHGPLRHADRRRREARDAEI